MFLPGGTVELEFNQWISDPVRENGGNLIEKRVYFLEKFVSVLEIFLRKNNYTLGKNGKIFKRKLAYWWFYMEKAIRYNKHLEYDGPRHRNHPYDFSQFFNIFDTGYFNHFLDKWCIEGFCDDSEMGAKISSEIKYFIYCWIDLASSPASEEVNQLLREEEEEKRYKEYILKQGPNRNEYDASDLGYYRGDRIMST